MMIAGKNRAHYSDAFLVRIEPELRAQLAAAAEREKLSMSELVRRGRAGGAICDAWAAF